MIWNVVSDSSCDLRMASFQDSPVRVEIVPLRIQVGEREFIDNDGLVIPEMLEAMKGDVRAAEFIRDTAGESPALDIRRQELKLRKDELKFKREQQAGAGASNTENNLLSAIMGAEEVDTDDLPEVE